MKTFGALLRQRRIAAGIGLRRFAEALGMEASNLSAIENGRRSPPVEAERLREIAQALGMVDGSPEWAEFFNAAARPGELPADIQHVAGRRMVPVLLRTIDNRQLSDEEIEQLVREVEARHGGE